MEIRILGLQELPLALDLVKEVFETDVSSLYTEEGIRQFQQFTQYEIMSEKCKRRELYFFGAFEEEELTGTLAVNRMGHISLFFVKKEWQGKGIGRKLYQRAYQLCVQGLKLERITANVTPGMAERFVHLGMHQVDFEQEAGGIIFVPMEAVISGEKKGFGNTSRAKAITIAVAAGIGIFLLVAVSAAFLAWGIFHVTDDPGYYYYEEDPFDGYFPYENWPEEEYGFEENGEESGLEQIPSYEADDLSYQTKEEVYHHMDTEKTTTYIEFHVMYPQLSGEGRDYTKVNQKIKECALETVDEIYMNPDETLKDKVVQADAPALVSNVVYQVCYASEDFISIAFQDTYAKGDASDPGGDLRTINIGLNNGKVYEIKDIVKIDDKFVKQWLKVMREEVEGNNEFLEELSINEMKEVLAGDTKGGIYQKNFFVCKNGIEIGLDFNYPIDDEHDLGYMWVTAPFSYEEAEKYATESEFWDYL